MHTSIPLGILYPIAGVIAMGFTHGYLRKRSPSLVEDFLMIPACSLVLLVLSLLLWPIYILGFLFLHRHFPDQSTPQAPSAPQESPTSHLGAEGHAHTDLTPAGSINLDGNVLDALSIDGFIEAGTAIRIVEQDSLALKVETIPEKP